MTSAVAARIHAVAPESIAIFFTSHNQFLIIRAVHKIFLINPLDTEYTETADEPHWIPMPDEKSGKSVSLSCAGISLLAYREGFFNNYVIVGRKLYSYLFKINYLG
jgi:hypothetical protein